MKYELTKTDYSADSTTVSGRYSCDITLGLHPTDNFTPDFSKTITVESDNSATGNDVDIQRAKAVNDYINQINN